MGLPANYGVKTGSSQKLVGRGKNRIIRDKIIRGQEAFSIFAPFSLRADMESAPTGSIIQSETQ